MPFCIKFAINDAIIKEREHWEQQLSKSIEIEEVEKIIDEFTFRPYFLDANCNPILAQRIILRELKPELKQKIRK